MTDWYGTFNGNGNYRLKVSVALLSQDIATNTSTLSRAVSVQKTGGSGYSTGNSNCSWGDVIDGVAHSGGWGPYDFGGISELPLSASTQVVTHNADGSKSVNVQGSATDPNNFGYTDIGSQTLVLPSIPRGPKVEFGGAWAQGLVLPEFNGAWATGLMYAEFNGAWVLVA